MARSTVPAPRHLSAEGRREWRAIRRDAPTDRRSHPVWLTLLTQYCVASDRARVAQAVIDVEGITRRDPRGSLRRHPAVKEMQRATRDLLRFYTLADLGAHHRRR